VSTEKLFKIYEIAEAKVEVLKDLNLKVASGEFVAICGVSGSGKTTLLNLISGIDKPTSGQITVFGEDLTDKDEDFLADLRCQKIGFVFQSYNLVSTLTVAENVAFPMEWTRKPVKQIEARVSELLETLGVQHRANHFPAQLSGGEQQRVAFARALANDPPLLLADEPTGNLDAFNSQKITDVLRMLKANGKTIIVSTHDKQLLKFADQKLCLEDGSLASYNE
jgi:putative ABC transport system ATP-binding protein